MKVAVIPARGGSKRVPRKNVRMFLGKPLIAHSISCAQESGVFDKIIVSTDDEEISRVAHDFGAEVPFIRPPELSNDLAGSADVMEHAVRFLMNAGSALSAVCCIYATAPFASPDDIKRGLELLEATSVDYVFSAATFDYPIFRSFRIGPAGVKMLFPEYEHTRSQDIPEALHDAGQFYWGRPSAWERRSSVLSGNAAVITIPRWRVQDIDTEEDWTRAELMAAYLKNTAASGALGGR